jgi:DNA-binding MarR family transcriptional regulator
MAHDHEYRLLDILSRQEKASQRQVAKESGLSLGMVNLVVRRLVRTGYIKTSTLNGQTVRYVLTRKGSAELARRSYEYMLHVVSSFGELRSGVAALMRNLCEGGNARFIIYGDGDVADLAELACRSTGLHRQQIVRQRDGVVAAGPEVVVLDCRVGVPESQRVGIDVLAQLAVHGSRKKEAFACPGY